jgi:uncharacterized protein
MTLRGESDMSTFEQVQALYEAEDYETAFKMLMPLAQAGDLKAQMSIAGMYSSGQGVQQSFTEAVKWYRLGAEQGDSIAQNNLAILLFSINSEEALQWMIIAAERGVPFAQSGLGDIYSEGISLPENLRNCYKDNSKAFEWYQRAGEGGFPYAYHRLGELYTNGKGIKKDEIEAVKCYEKAAEQGYSPSQEILAQAYQYGLLGLDPDLEKSKYWLNKLQAND